MDEAAQIPPAVELSPDERQTWQAVSALLAELPDALERQLQRDAGLSLMEYSVLAALQEQPDQSLRISHLAGLSGCELSRLSHLMSRLERRQLVRRQRDPANGRYTNAVLTEAGRCHLQSAQPGHIACLRSLFFEVLEPAQQHRLRETVSQLLIRLRQAHRGPGQA
jgi:DNA-binding MarR family transcriptional regulator